MQTNADQENYVAENREDLVPHATMPAFRNIIRAATYAQICCMQHIWAHMRRDFIQCAAAQVRLTGWCETWLARIAAIYRLNEARLDCYDPGIERQSAAFDAAQGALAAALDGLFATAERELAGLPEHAREGKPLRSLVNHREGLSVFADRPRVPLDNNLAYSGSGISEIIPDHGLFRTRFETRHSPRHRAQDAGIITSCLLPLARSPAYAKEKTDVDNQLLSFGGGGLGPAVYWPARRSC